MMFYMAYVNVLDEDDEQEVEAFRVYPLRALLRNVVHLSEVNHFALRICVATDDSELVEESWAHHELRLRNQFVESPMTTQQLVVRLAMNNACHRAYMDKLEEE